MVDQLAENPELLKLGGERKENDIHVHGHMWIHSNIRSI